jgi:hypothetical protein
LQTIADGGERSRFLTARGQGELNMLCLEVLWGKLDESGKAWRKWRIILK